MLNTRFSRLSLLAVFAGSCLVFAPGGIASEVRDAHAPAADGHASKPAEPSGHGGGSENGGAAKPAYAPPPVAKGVSLKTPPAAPAKIKPTFDAAGEPKQH